MTVITPVIMAGGNGTRLWPVSRAMFPKQLIPIHTQNSLLQETALRVAGSVFRSPLVICNDEHRFLVAEQLRQVAINPHAIVLEPIGRNTAPAAAVAALMLVAENPDGLLLLLSSDHVIQQPDVFVACVRTVAPVAAAGRLVTFGITPDRPETGYGYIRAGVTIDNGPCREVEAFVEKPDRTRAEGFLRDGNYYFNSGMFLMRASTLLDEMERLRPEMLAQCRAVVGSVRHDGPFQRLDGDAFAAIASASIDYAIMEHTAKAAVVPVAMGWSDVGDWDALWALGARNEDGNVLSGDVITEETSDCYIRGDGRIVAALGVSGLVIVDTADALLVASRDSAQNVKVIVDRLRRENRPEHLLHKRVYRPWGWYQALDAGDRYQVKHISVNPGHGLSLQMHYHRAEHWVVVSGTARVTCGESVKLLHENESTFIPQGTQHRLENPGRIPLRLIEVQSGAYLGEEDIVRYDDSYGRR